MDIDEIEPGADFAAVLSESLKDCGVLLAVIGPHWLDERDDNGTLRLEAPNDYVRLEISGALRSNIPVIPVLVDGAALPGGDELPDELRSLISKQAVELSHQGFDRDANALAARIKTILPPTSISRYVTIGVIGVFVFCTFFVLVDQVLWLHWYFNAAVAALLTYPTTRYFMGLIRRKQS